MYRNLFLARLKELEEGILAAGKEIEGRDHQLEVANQALLLCKKALEQSLERKKYVEAIISSGLTEVYGVQYSYELREVLDDAGVVRGLKPTLKRVGGLERDPYRRFGRGAKDVMNICYNFALILLEHSTARLLVMDEPLSHISPEMQEKLEQFMKNICKKSGLQLVMITHQDAPFGKVYEVKKKMVDGVEYSEVFLRNE